LTGWLLARLVCLVFGLARAQRCGRPVGRPELGHHLATLGLNPTGPSDRQHPNPHTITSDLVSSNQAKSNMTATTINLDEVSTPDPLEHAPRSCSSPRDYLRLTPSPPRVQEVRLFATNADRERIDELATLFSIITSLDYLERAYVRDSITQSQSVHHPHDPTPEQALGR